MIQALVNDNRVLVCVGPGGVGKTTIAAAVAALSARHGKRTLVCTIDPAPRLADALGTGGLGAEPKRLPPDACRALGMDGAEGKLHAVRIDTEATFERLVNESVADPEMRRRIFDNVIYRQITTMLTGSQEFAATLALHDFAASGRFDLVVLDTPPTANALDFLEAPGRIAAAVSSPALSWFRAPAPGGEAVFVPAPAFGGRPAGAADGQAGRQPLSGGRGGVPGRFSGGADRVPRARPGRGQAAARPGRRLPAGAGAGGGGDRRGAVFPRAPAHARASGSPVSSPTGCTRRRASTRRRRSRRRCGRSGGAGLPAATIDDAAARLAPVARAFAALAVSERRELGRLGARAPGVPITEVPLLDHDVDNLAELRVVGEHLSAV
jgi:hypothetical protein